MATQYDSFAGGNGAIEYNAGSTTVYPDADVYNVFGPVWLPRVYGKDLSSFEVASSGSVAITLHDVHSLDFDRDTVNKITQMTALSNDSLVISANHSNMFIQMDATGNDMTLFAASNLTLSNGGKFEQAVAGDLKFTAGAVLACQATSNVVLTSLSNDIVGTALSNVTLTATAGSFTTIAGSNAALTAKTGTIHIAAQSNLIDVTAASNISITSGSNFVATAAANAKVTSGAGQFSVDPSFVTVEAFTGEVQILADSNLINMTAASNISVTAGSNFVATAAANAKVTSGAGQFSVDPSFVTVEAFTGEVQILADSNLINMTAASNISVTAGSNFVATAAANAKVTSGAGQFSVDPSFVTVEAFTGEVQILADSNLINMTAASNISVTAGSNFVATAAANAKITSGAGQFSVDPAFVTVEAFTGEVHIKADSNLINMIAASNISVTAGDNLATYATQDASFVSGVDTAIAASNSLSLFGLSNVSQTAQAGSWTAVAGSNVALTASNDLKTYSLMATSLVSGTDTAIAASNSLSLFGKSNVSQTAQAGSWTAVAGSNVALTASNDLSTYSLMATSLVSGTDTAIAASNSLSLFGKSNVTQTAQAGTWAAVAGSNVTLTASNDLATYSLKATSLVSGTDTAIAASNSLSLFGLSNVSQTAQAGSWTAVAGSNVALTASNDLATYSLKATSLVSGTDTAVAASNNLSLWGLCNVSQTAQQGTFSILAGNSASVTTSNALSLTSASNTTVTAYQSLQLKSGNGAASLFLDANSNASLSNQNLYVNTASNIQFVVGGNTMFSLNHNKLTLNGDLDLIGTVNSISTVATELHVADKNILLASTSNAEESLLATGGAGVILDGLPTGVTTDSNGLFEKSLKWQYGSLGTPALMTSNLGEAAYWELRGGEFRLTTTKASDGTDVSYCFRIGHNDQLELCKYYSSNGAMTWKRVAKFAALG
jgi:uncharacterized protein (DUF2345 family)